MELLMCGVSISCNMSKHSVKVHRWKNKRLLTNNHEFESEHDARNFLHHQIQFGTRDLCIKIYNGLGELIVSIGDCDNCPETYA